MSKKTQTRFLPVLLFSILILIPQGTTANLVVCIESDGQINVETAHHGVCCPSSVDYSYERHPFPSSGKGILAKLHFSSCTDIAVFVSDLEQSLLPGQGELNLIEMQQNAFLVSSRLLYESSGSEGFAFCFLLPDKTVFSFLKSTILLI